MHPIWITFLIILIINLANSSPLLEQNDYKNLRKYVNRLEQDVQMLTDRLKNTEERLEVVEHSACVKFCNVSGTIYLEGANFTSGCDVCLCSHGKIVCRPKQCPVTKCKYPETPVGECCAKCKRKCFFENQLYEHSEELKRKHKSKCISCVCNDGVMKCSDVNPKCPRLKCPLSEQLPVDEGCCNYCPNTDFCKEGHNCDSNASCHNLRTKYECTCNQGYKGNGTNCVDINECLVKGGPDGHFCNHNTFCENTPGSYKCACLPGYEKNDSFNCIDIDECKHDSLNKCGSNSICVNIAGGHRCECEPGYRLINGECRSKCDDCCRRNEKLFLHGQLVPTDDICSKCKCEFGQILCRTVLCTQATCTDNEIDARQCCPICKKNCTLNDESIPHKGQTIKRIGATCMNCRCNNGILTCKKLRHECPKLNCSINGLITSGCCLDCLEPAECDLCDRKSTRCKSYGKERNVTCECKSGLQKLNEFSCI